ncbi:MAG: DoxX family membrane protein [Euryarchaeota archaeon]|nr:DoxX family membrane protein [Euryarchaeota archaeon]
MSPVGLPSTLLHVRYVADGEGRDPGPLELLKDAYGDPLGLAALASILIGLAVVAVVLPRLKTWDAWRLALTATMEDYRPFLPWILRLSAGIALVAAGVTRTWFVPHLDHGSRVVAILFLATGFGILVGVLVRPLALLAIALWGFAFAFLGTDLLYAAETVAALVALTALSAGSPSVDDIMARTMQGAPGPLSRLARLSRFLGPERDADLSDAYQDWMPFVLRVGLGVSLLAAGLGEKLLSPAAAFWTVDHYGLAFGPVTPALWVASAGFVEALIGLLLLVGLGTRPIAVAAFLVLTVTLFALPDDPVAAHVPLWGVASAVIVLGPGGWSLDARARRAAAS